MRRDVDRGCHSRSGPRLMTEYTFKAYSKTGDLVIDRISASDQAEALSLLAARGLAPQQLQVALGAAQLLGQPGQQLAVGLAVHRRRGQAHPQGAVVQAVDAGVLGAGLHAQVEHAQLGAGCAQAGPAGGGCSQLSWPSCVRRPSWRPSWRVLPSWPQQSFAPGSPCHPHAAQTRSPPCLPSRPTPAWP